MDVGILTRYFLRRYALARHDPANVIPYITALFEVIVVALLFPFAALYSILVIASLRWSLLSPGQIDRMITLDFWLPLTLVPLAIGIFVFTRKFSRYRRDPSMCAEFDSERDRKIVFWQRTTCIAICGFVVPVLALVVAYGFF